MKKNLLFTFLLVLIVIGAIAQEQDTTKTTFSSSGPGEQFNADSLVKHELSPLDITKDRGLYIITPDGKMQLRILGSVRYSILYDFVDMPVKKVYNSYYIPTGA